MEKALMVRQRIAGVITNYASKSSPETAQQLTMEPKRMADDEASDQPAAKRLAIESRPSTPGKELEMVEHKLDTVTEHQDDQQDQVEPSFSEPNGDKVMFRPALYKLPVELIQQIFLYRSNLRMPLASSLLYKALNTDSVKMALMMDLFSWVGPREPIEELNHGKLWKSLCWHPNLVQITAEKREEQRTVLRKCWMRYDLLRRCQWVHLEKVATEELREFMAPVIEVWKKERCLAELRSSLRSNFIWGKFSRQYIYPSQTKRKTKSSSASSAHSFRLDRGDGNIFEVFMPDELGLNSMLVVILTDKNKQGSPRTVKTSVFPALSYQIRIPSQLVYQLHLQPRAYLFETIVEASGWSFRGGTAKPKDYFEELESARRACCKELTNAIRLWHLPSARLILGSPNSSHWKQSRTEAFKEDGNRLDATKRVTLGPHLDLRLDYPGTWRGINEASRPAWERIENREVVLTEHLKQVLRVGPVGKAGWAWFHWLGAHKRCDVRQLQSIAAAELPNIQDPARYEMVEALAKSGTRCVRKI